MANKYLIGYIDDAKQSGTPREEIEKTLIGGGWSERDVRAAFFFSDSPHAPVSGGWKIPAAIGAVILLLVAGVGAFFLLRAPAAAPVTGPTGNDVAPVSDADALSASVSVPDAENAYADLVKAAGLASLPADKTLIFALRSENPWNDTAARDLVEKNGPMFTALATALLKPRFQDPAYGEPAKMPLASATKTEFDHNALRTVTDIALIRSMLAAKTGRPAEALKEAFDVAAIAQKIEVSQTDDLQMLVAVAAKVGAMEVVQKAIAAPDIARSDLVTRSAEIDGYYGRGLLLVNHAKGTYTRQARTIDGLAKGDTEALGLFSDGNDRGDLALKARDPYYLKPNAVKSLFLEYARTTIGNAGRPCNDAQKLSVPQLVPDLEHATFEAENSLGNLVHDLLSGGLLAQAASLTEKKCQEDLAVAAAQAGLAIRAYVLDTGDMPASLDVLAPKYFTVVPADPYDGKPLRYSPEKKLVYSVGPDGKDDGGALAGDWRTSPDPSFAVAF